MSVTEAKPPQLMKCPGCKNIVDTSKYGAHVLGNHKTDIYTQEIPMPGGSATGAGEEKFSAWINDQLKHHFRFFALWTAAMMIAGYILIAGRI